MIDRTRRSKFLTTLAALVLGFCALIGVAGRPSAQVMPAGFPCSTRSDVASCHAECDDDDETSPPPFLADCQCLWDDRNPQEVVTQCPPGEVCCWNAPCERFDGLTPALCVAGGGGSVVSAEDEIILIPNHCSYSSDQGECRCTPPLVDAGYDDLSVDIENSYDAPFDCRCPFTTDEQWLRLDVCNPPGVSKLAIKLNFAKPARDGIGLKGTLAVPAGFAVAGATLEVSIGGLVKAFTLDAKGKAKVGTDHAKLFVKAKKGVVAAQDAKLNINLTKGSFAAAFADEGLVNATVTAVAVSVPVEIQLNGTMYAKTQPQLYSAKTGKSGSTKDPR
jgi:hypothetical protein